jgi:hypothetical protein
MGSNYNSLPDVSSFIKKLYIESNRSVIFNILIISPDRVPIQELMTIENEASP